MDPAAGGNENLPPVVTTEVPADAPGAAEDHPTAPAAKKAAKAKVSLRQCEFPSLVYAEGLVPHCAICQAAPQAPGNLR